MSGHLHQWDWQKLEQVTWTQQATTNADVDNHIADHHLHTNNIIEWDFAEYIKYLQYELLQTTHSLLT